MSYCCTSVAGVDGNMNPPPPFALAICGCGGAILSVVLLKRFFARIMPCLVSGLLASTVSRQVVEFSPCETYVMTCNFEQGDKAIIVWEVLTGQMLRAFPMATTTAAGKVPSSCLVALQSFWSIRFTGIQMPSSVCAFFPRRRDGVIRMTSHRHTWRYLVEFVAMEKVELLPTMSCVTIRTQREELWLLTQG